MYKKYLEQYLVHSRRHFRRSEPVQVQVEDDRTGTSIEAIRRAIADNLYYMLGVDIPFATPHDYYLALAYSVRDRLVHRWIKTVQTYFSSDSKAVFYLSAEFLMGRQLGNNLINAGLWEATKQALIESGLDLYDLLEQEAEPGLGNGGLGRLAACFLDSLATLDIPAMGYGIRYDYGIFEQVFRDGWQVERPDRWRRLGNPWEISRPGHAVEINFYGHTERYRDENGKDRVRWLPEKTIIGTPHDTLVPGYNTNTVNTLRLWSAGASNEFDLQVFNTGDYTRAVEDKVFSENISKVLYPNDDTPQGKELRLQQQYFFVCCSLRDIVRMYLWRHKELSHLYRKVAIQLNDTHPAIAIPELMRILLDERGMDWDKAWNIVTQTFAYTNHTLLSEALERWPVSLISKLLPRHMEIIYDINHRFLEEVKQRFPHDTQRLARMSIIDEGHHGGSARHVRMAHLACVGSYSINGVAALHSELLRTQVLSDFAQMWPEKFSNKTNGVTPRRWILASNPKLALLITSNIGRKWIKDLEELRSLESFVEDSEFCAAWREIKRDNKNDLAEYIYRKNKIEVNPDSIFDVQVKRLHEYKRQLLNALFIITLYNRLRRHTYTEIAPRTFIFGAKAAPGYVMAKLIIKLINSIADVVNNDPVVKDKLKVVFLENYNVTLGERVYPAADLSEQISTAGREASGTGNMKFALNGALTIGTLDGANVEIRNAVGPENFFLFGHTVEQLQVLQNHYQPRDYYSRNWELREVIDQIASGYYSQGASELFQPIVRSLLERDEYFLLADYESYVECQMEVDKAYRDTNNWTKKSILNTSRTGFFSSDRTIREYNDEIWRAKPMSVDIGDYQSRDAMLNLCRSKVTEES